MISTPPPSGPSDQGVSREPAQPPAPGAAVDAGGKWPVWTAPAAIAMGFAVGVCASVIVGAIASVNGGSLAHPTPAVALISDVLFDLGFVVAALFFSRVRGRPSPADFGFRRIKWRTGVLAVIAAGASYYLITAVYASLLNLHGNDKLPKELGVSGSTAALVGATVFVCVIAPIVGVFLFRGFLFGA